MEDLTGKVSNGGATAEGILSPDEWNQLPSEVQNVIATRGQALNNADLNQLGKAIAEYSIGGQVYTDTGAADAYVLTATGGRQAITALSDGDKFRFIPANTNTGASTANISGLGVVDIKKIGGVDDPAAGYIQSGVEVTLTYRTAPSAHFELTSDALGVYQHWQDVTISRAIGVTYTNTTGKPIAVQAGVGDNVTNRINFRFIVGGISLPQSLSEGATGTGNERVLSVEVPSGSTYILERISGTGTLETWVELR